ncbi:lipopolysaccharide biosynthesis protein [Kineococcus sp. GCM10028916]|uniref:lipopolysaccharide biosynthesis protein n=1 Tax=Kineococcus sp. GCM10028916 TaxID=3273394 RepID=UPI003634F322
MTAGPDAPADALATPSPPAAGGSPLRSGTAVAAGMGIVSLAGFLTWIIAARSMTREEVGQLSGFVNAFMLVSGAGQLGIGLVLTRYLPVAGRAMGKMLLWGDLALVASVLAVTGVFSLTPFADTIGAGLSHPMLVLTALTVLWSLYSLQAQVFPAIGRAGWSLPNSVAFSLARLGMLWALASAGVLTALASWWVPCALSVLVMGVLIHRRGVRAHRETPAVLPTRRQVVSYAGGNWVASLWGTLFWSGLPLLVLQMLGPSVSAVFSALHILVQTVDNLAGRYGAQLIIAAASDRGSLARHARTLVRAGAVVVLPGLAVLALVAPLILHAFGQHYVDEGATPLRIMVAVLALRLVQQLMVNIWRATDRTLPVVLVHIAQVVPVLVLLGTGVVDGLVGVALTLLGTQIVLSGLMVRPLVRALRSRVAPTLDGVAAVEGSGELPTPRGHLGA